MNNKTVIAYTDGSCVYNGRNNACAGYAYIFPLHDLYEYNYIYSGTNNRAELMAILKAIQTAKKDFKANSLVIKTDSQYCINAIHSWIYKWKRYAKSDGTWIKPDKQHVKNQDLLKAIDRERNESGFYLSAVFVKAHTSNQNESTKWNAVVDKLAKISCNNQIDNNKNSFHSRGSMKEIQHIINKAHNDIFQKPKV